MVEPSIIWQDNQSTRRLTLRAVKYAALFSAPCSYDPRTANIPILSLKQALREGVGSPIGSHGRVASFYDSPTVPSLQERLNPASADTCRGPSIELSHRHAYGFSSETLGTPCCSRKSSCTLCKVRIALSPRIWRTRGRSKLQQEKHQHQQRLTCSESRISQPCR